MKKLFICLAMLLTCGIVASKPITYVHAEETPTSVVQPSNSTSISVTENTDKEPTQDEMEETIKNQLTEWLEQYLDKDLVAKIISWAVDIGVIGYMAVINLKYRKYKNKTIGEVVDGGKDLLQNELHKCFSNLDKETIKNVSTQVNEIVVKIDQLMKALALAQDKTAEGKIALLNLISENTTQADTKEVVTEVKEQIQKEQKVEEEVKEKVANDYTPID